MGTTEAGDGRPDEDDLLPDELEADVLRALDLPVPERNERIEELCRRHPDRASAIGAYRRAGATETTPSDSGSEGATFGSSPAVITLPFRLGSYDLYELLAQGGMGTVYKARDTRLERDVAVKVVRGDRLFASDAGERLNREAKAAAQLEHPGICPIYEVDEDRGIPYLAMRLVPGETLERRLARARRTAEGRGGDTTRSAAIGSPLPATRGEILAVCQIVEKVARALHVAHEAGLIHRDIKPSNIMITDGDEPVILDFGLARPQESTGHSLTREGDTPGTPPYMAPEQLSPKGRRLDGRVDVYSLGATLFECLTLRQPFEAGTREELFQKIVCGSDPDCGRLNSAIPRDLCVVVAKAMRREREARYAGALEFAEDLRRYREGVPIQARPVSRLERLWRRAQRHPAMAAGLAVVAALSASLIWVTADAAAADAARVQRLKDYYRGLIETEAARGDDGAQTLIQPRGGLLDATPAFRLRTAERETRDLVLFVEEHGTGERTGPVPVAAEGRAATARPGIRFAPGEYAWWVQEEGAPHDAPIPEDAARFRIPSPLKRAALEKALAPGNAPLDRCDRASKLFDHGFVAPAIETLEPWDESGDEEIAELRVQLLVRALARTNDVDRLRALPVATRPKATIPEGRRHALLVGIQDYPAEVSALLDRLRGPRNDVAAMQDLLVHRFAFSPERVTMLLDEAATLAGILGAFETLLHEVQPGDEVWFYFSGHGSRVPDASGREPSGFDAALVAYDSRSDARRGGRDLSDDALYSLVWALTERLGARVTVLVDAGYSGGGVRSADPREARGAPDGASPTHPGSWKEWPAGVTFFEDDERPLFELRNYVYLAACSSLQQAHELSVADGVRGLFSWSLLHALHATEPTDTYRSVSRRTEARMVNIPGGAGQTLDREGDLDRRLFGGDFQPPTPGFEAMATPTGLRIGAGNLLGIVPGVVLRVQDERGDDVGTARVDRASVGEATARWQMRAERLPINAALRVEVEERPRDLSRLQLHTPSPELAAMLADDPWAEVVGEDAGASYRLDVHEGHLRLRTLDGLLLWPRLEEDRVPPSAAGMEALRRKLCCESQFVAFWGLADPEHTGERGDLELRWVEPTKQELASNDDFPHGFAPAMPTDGGIRVATFDEQQDNEAPEALATLLITNRNDRRVYAYVLSVAESRERTVVYPEQAPSLLGPSQSARVPVWLGAATPGEFPLQRPMRERYLFIASDVPLNLHRFEERLVAPTRSGGDGMPGILQSAVEATVTRGRGTYRDGEKGWGVTWVDLLVSRG